MSWWVGVEIDSGGEEPAELSDRNITYNVGGMFRAALGIPEPGIHIEDYRCRCRYAEDGGHETGLKALHGAPCTEAAGAISAALARMDADPATYQAMNPPNGWGSYDSARKDLRWLLGQCRAHPKGSIYVH